MAGTVIASKATRKAKPATPAATVAGPTLAEIQASFQRALMADDPAVLAEIVDSPSERREVLLGVYQNAYIMRLLGFLRTDHEKLAALAGNDAMDRIGRAYFVAHPSRHPNARWASAKLPEFLSQDRRFAGTPILAEMARLERALSDAFDAADAGILRLTHLGAVDPRDWPRLAFSPQPSVRRLTLNTNAVEIWRAINSGSEPPMPAALTEPMQVAAYRHELTARFRILGYDEAMAWDEMCKGVAFGGLCEMLAMYGGEADAAIRAASLLKGWIDEEMLVAPA